MRAYDEVRSRCDFSRWSKWRLRGISYFRQKTANCPLPLPTAHCPLPMPTATAYWTLYFVFLLLYFLFYQTLRVWVNFFLKAISHLDIRRDLTRIGAPFSCRRRAGDDGLWWSAQQMWFLPMVEMTLKRYFVFPAENRKQQTAHCHCLLHFVFLFLYFSFNQSPSGMSRYKVYE